MCKRWAFLRRDEPRPEGRTRRAETLASEWAFSLIRVKAHGVRAEQFMGMNWQETCGGQGPAWEKLGQSI